MTSLVGQPAEIVPDSFIQVTPVLTTAAFDELHVMDTDEYAFLKAE